MSQRVLSPELERQPRPAGVVPLPVVLQVPRFGGPAEPVAPAAAEPPRRVVYRPAPAAPMKALPTAPRPLWRRRLIGTLTLAALALAPSVAIHWQDWGFASWADAVRAAAVERWRSVTAGSDDDLPLAPVEPAGASERPARLAPYILPVESERGAV